MIRAGPSRGTNGHPTMLAPSGTWTGVANFKQFQPVAGAISNRGIIYRGYDRGLTLQGSPDSGGAYDLTIANKNDAPVMAVNSGTTTARFFGPLQVDFNYLLLNGTVAFPALIETQGVVFSHATDGASIAGYGSAYDASVRNRTGALALGVNANSVNLSAAGSFTAAGAILTTGGGVGYSTGAGGTVTQATSKSTGVTLNKLSGQITMSAAALAANTTVSFTLTNSQIAATDVLVLNHASGGTAGAYVLNGQCGAGSVVINVRNVTAGSLSEAIVIRFAVVKAVTA